MEEDEDSMRVNQVLQRDMRAKAEYEPATEVESLTNKSNRRNGDLGRGYESMESLTEKMSRELVVKEAKGLELEKKALEAEKRRKSLESKYEASLQEQIKTQMKVINILSEKVDQLVGGGDVTDDGY